MSSIYILGNIFIFPHTRRQTLPPKHDSDTHRFIGVRFILVNNMTPVRGFVRSRWVCRPNRENSYPLAIRFIVGLTHVRNDLHPSLDPPFRYQPQIHEPRMTQDYKLHA